MHVCVTNRIVLHNVYLNKLWFGSLTVRFTEGGEGLISAYVNELFIPSAVPQPANYSQRATNHAELGGCHENVRYLTWMVLWRNPRQSKFCNKTIYSTSKKQLQTICHWVFNQSSMSTARNWRCICRCLSINLPKWDIYIMAIAIWRPKNGGEKYRLSHKKSSFLQQHQSSLPLLPFATRRDGRIIGHDVCCM